MYLSLWPLTSCISHLQDLQLWEDLCVLEGRLGIRYLTHETEDMFWEDQGAKPHPLARKEPERPSRSSSAHTTPDTYTPTSTPPTPHSTTSSPGSRRMVKFANNSNGSLPAKPQGEEKIGKGSALYFLDPNVVESTPGQEESNGSPDMNADKGKYLNRRDEEVVEALEHAKRVGYKVSTV